MERIRFLKSLMIGAVSTTALVGACKKDSTSGSTTTDSSTNGTTTTTTGGATTTNGCTLAPDETEGPFPTKAPASYVRSDITGDRTGYKLTSKITIVNHANCNVVSGLLVDIWHCDAAGNYSEYGGTSMQTTDYTSVHFLRGRQTTDTNGLVTFTSIFPGWYSGRATHIHAHIYNASGTSLKITQIAFPEGTGTALVAVNGYAKGMTGYTYNSSDGVFSDDTAGIEIATVTGNITDGFSLSINLSVTV